MADQALYSKLTKIFAEVFERDDIVLQPHLSAANVDGWDSFKQIELIFAVQRAFAIKLTTIDVDSMRNVGDLVAAIERGLSR